MKEYIIRLLSDPGFMGALLGALITGAIGITIMIVQLKKQEKSERVRELKYFYKSMFEFVHTVQSTVKQLMMSSTFRGC